MLEKLLKVMTCQPKSSKIIPTFFSKFFPEQLKYADVKAVFKKDSRTDKKTIDQSAFWLMYLKIMKGVSSN